MLVISDEIYSELTYGGDHSSIASIEDMRDARSSSTAFQKPAMTVEISYALAPQPIISQMLKIHQYDYGKATPSQYAAMELCAKVLKTVSAVKAMKAEYNSADCSCSNA